MRRLKLTYYNTLPQYFMVLLSVLSMFLIMSFVKNGNKNDDINNVYESGRASYYCNQFIGRKTASGEIFTLHEYTCAHKTLPFGTKLKVTNLSNNRAIIVKVNDRGPFVKNRIVDLSLQGAKDLCLLQSGTAQVTIEIVHPKFSSLGKIENMEKLLVDNIFAYVNRADNSAMNRVYDWLQSSMQMGDYRSTATSSIITKNN